MAKELKIEVSQELVDYTERLSFEEASLKDIITTYLDIHKADADDSAINNPIFESYQKRYIAAKTEYELAKKRVTSEFVPECLNGHEYDWNLDFASNILTITIKCDCGIAAFEEYLNSLKKTDDIQDKAEEKVTE